ncbi:heavy-metal-associated domain-containing protein [Aureibaculum sp. 2210JD6-5]|uniref:heavy-metal-associated domain-containing protein n=1 Tax=Aureibaculum sp. 2210JD6-5 TaxID=3103957 RepID=UPI002AAD7A98|nr:heavy-metal-associated domain-containing protein [Aureibaculum sp. 2210JD6-5]MDY7394925.1 heavy-metal-associated domain-containing protein [Aureibaculum sp. 2210JD6-5]
MKILKAVIFLISIGVLFSCDKNSKTDGAKNADIIQKSDSDSEKIVANFEKVSLKIDGMTCEIGCARTIQSKLSKANGVKFAEVNFEDKTGIVEFDSNKISENQIVKIVEEIAGGDLYKVEGVKKSE